MSIITITMMRMRNTSITTITMMRMRNMSIITIITMMRSTNITIITMVRNADVDIITIMIMTDITIMQMRSLPAGEPKHRKNIQRKRSAISWISWEMRKNTAWSFVRKAC